METLVEKINWEELVSESYYETIWAIEQQIKAFDNEEALLGLHYLYENMAKKDRRELKNFLILLMVHVLKWKYQPQKRTHSWRKTIRHARKQIKQAKEDFPSITNNYILNVWSECFADALEDAVDEMNIHRNVKFNPDTLTWQEVFEDEYYLEDND